MTSADAHPASDALPTASPPTPEAEQAVMQACLFELEGTRCAVAARQIVQILEVETLAPLPLAPAHVVGVTFYENSPLAILRLRGEDHEETRNQVAAVLQEGAVRVGLEIDAVFGFRGLQNFTGQVPPVPAALQPFVESVLADGEHPAVLLSVPGLIRGLRPTLRGASA